MPSPEVRCRTDSSTGKHGPSLQGTGAAAVQPTHEDSNTANGIADKVFTNKPALKNCKYLPELAAPLWERLQPRTPAQPVPSPR